MDRRSFIKFMGITPVAAAASNALAKIPEAEKRIQLLDEPKIITPANTEYFEFSGVIRYSYRQSNEVYGGKMPYSPVSPFGIISATVELYDSNLELHHGNSNASPIVPLGIGYYQKVRFPQFDELKNKTFIINEWEIVAQANEITICNIKGYEIGA